MHDDGETVLTTGMYAGFAPNGAAHQSDRQPGDSVSYPRDDLVAVRAAGSWE